ncbi:inner membrane transporter RhtA [Kitasatospora gansuensis]|uniref:Inner membrane transporter RhtA n=1 Tax=Kitasatospora gansuensis TaxID=258050 RepID=A0A7W7WEU8_9ACTN|nr:EamA family transporter [Kitasatospora gansuensis]MBB4945147.1 inner membrane transporter RhtA [Kitasatospora gansuensis]
MTASTSTSSPTSTRQAVGTPVRRPVPGAVLVLAAMAVLHTGSALATELFDSIGPAGTTWLRIAFAAVVLLAWTGRSLGPALRAASRRDLIATALLGAVSAALMLLFSEATARVPLGTATALEFLGPLAVAVAASKRRSELGWLALAAVGVLLLTSPWTGAVSGAGVLFGLAAAACWALYVIGTAHVGSRFTARHGLALSLTVAAVVSAPFGAPAVAADFDWGVIAAAAGIAVLMPLLPFLLEMTALQRIGKTTYGTLVGLEPAISLLAGLILISQIPTAVQVCGTVLVVAAGIGAARRTR